MTAFDNAWIVLKLAAGDADDLYIHDYLREMIEDPDFQPLDPLKMEKAWAFLKDENEFEDEWDPATASEEAFKGTAYSGWNVDDDWADHFPEDFDFEGLEAENYDEEIHREYPTGQSGYSPGMKDLRRSHYSPWESSEENEKRFNDLMDNPTREPILVVRDKHGEEHILSGYHRMAANIESGRPHLPALVLNMRDGE